MLKELIEAFTIFAKYVVDAPGIFSGDCGVFYVDFPKNVQLAEEDATRLAALGWTYFNGNGAYFRKDQY